MEKVTYEEARERLEKRVHKQHDYRVLPRTRCVVTWNERLEFILPEGTEAAAFCRGEKTLNPKEHQIVFPGSQPELLEVIVNFDTGKVVYVIPEV